MRHHVDGRKLGRTAAHRRALYRNLVIALVKHGRIKTTTPKAKEARRFAERMITFAKRGDLSARRHVARHLNHPEAVQKLFDELGPRYKDRPGGYTRVLKIGGPRRGDNAEMSLLELVRDGDRPKKKKKKAKRAAAKSQPKSKAKPKVKKDEAADEKAAAASAAAAAETVDDVIVEEPEASSEAEGEASAKGGDAEGGDGEESEKKD